MSQQHRPSGRPFGDLDLGDKLQAAIKSAGFEACTEVQDKMIDQALEGRDLMVRSQTGTGKTAAYLISGIESMRRANSTAQPSMLAIAPTRELALQIEADARVLTKGQKLRITCVVGGRNVHGDLVALERGQPDILIGTPGRLVDLLRRDVVRADGVKYLVIDEADRMLDFGFLPDVRRIVQATADPSERTTWMLSATMPAAIKRVAHQWLTDPVTVDVAQQSVAADTIDQRVFIVAESFKLALLWTILQEEDVGRAIVFANRRDQVARIGGMLAASGENCAIMSGELTQARRLATLKAFKEGKTKILVATDVAGRGLHVEDLTHVINYTLPDDHDDYVHRIGRTGRVGQKGVSVSFATEFDGQALPKLERAMNTKLTYYQADPDELEIVRRWLSEFTVEARSRNRDTGRGSRRPQGGSKPRGRSNASSSRSRRSR